jgi:hypothetical protein
MKHVRTIAQKVGRAAAHNDGVAGLRRHRHHLIGDLPDAVCVHHPQARGVECAFKAASQECLEQTIVQRVFPLRALFNGPAIAIHAAGDFVGQRLIPQLPVKALRQVSGDIGAAASKFALNGNHSDHAGYPTATSPPARGSFFRMTKASKNMIAAPIASTLNASR